jgi:hypothetical protein
MALFDGDRDRKMDRDHALEEWRHDPGHRGNVPYRDAAVSAMFRSGTPEANFNPAFRGPSMDPTRVGGFVAALLPQRWQRPGTESARLPLNADRAWPGGTRAPREGGRSLIALVQLGLGSVQPALQGVDPVVAAGSWNRFAAFWR